MSYLNTLTSISGIVEYIQINLPPIFTTNVGTKVYNILSAIGRGFQINTNQINELYEKTKIDLATSDDLDNLIKDYVSFFTRKTGESDEDYKERYIKRIFRYNSSYQKVLDQVYDVSGYYPKRIYNLNGRTGYWGLENYENNNAKHYFYNNIRENEVFWGNIKGTNPFTVYISLYYRPTDSIIRELCNTLNSARKVGTTIYLKVNDGYSYGSSGAIYGTATYS